MEHGLNRKHAPIQLVFKDHEMSILPPIGPFVETRYNIVHEIKDSAAWGTSIALEFCPP
jgi:hypothetical protein